MASLLVVLRPEAAIYDKIGWIGFSWGRAFDIGPFFEIAPRPVASTNQLHLDVGLTSTGLTGQSPPIMDTPLEP